MILDGSGVRNIANLNDQMKVITHQAIGMDSMIESFNAFLEQQEKLASIHVFEKN